MDIKTLLKKYMSGKIKADDFKLLKDYTHDTSDKDLDTTFEALWMESDRKPMNRNTKDGVKETLDRQLLFSKKKTSLNWKNIVAAVLLPILMFSTAYFYITSLKPSQEFIVASAKGQKTQIYLPDGTKVWLNSESHISYNSDYNQNNRQVSLKGEAFFDVKENDKVKFIVDVGGVAVNVHGTAFNVTAYQSDSIISVSLNKGKVNIENTKNQQILASMSPNQQVIVNRNNLSSTLMTCDADLNSLWIQNRLKLEDAATEELFKKMEHWYGVNINVENIKSQNKYSLTIKAESLREMLDLINKLTPITYQINGEEVKVIYKK